MKVIWSILFLLVSGCSTLSENESRYGATITVSPSGFTSYSYSERWQALQVDAETADKGQYQLLAQQQLADLSLQLWFKQPQMHCAADLGRRLSEKFSRLSRSAGFQFAQPQLLSLYVSVAENFEYKEKLSLEQPDLALFYSFSSCQQSEQQLMDYYGHAIHELMHWLMIRRGIGVEQIGLVQHEYWASRGAYCALLSNPGFVSLDPFIPSEFSAAEKSALQKTLGVNNATELGVRLLHNELHQLLQGTQLTSAHPQLRQIREWCQQTPKVPAGTNF